MTKREHDKATKSNNGKLFGQRTDYRANRGYVAGRDYIADRAAYQGWRNSLYGIAVEGFLPTLALGSKWRAFAQFRMLSGRALLG